VQRIPYEFTKLISCWQDMQRETNRAPQKTTFSPVSVSSLMPFLFLIEKEEKGSLAVRLLGSELEKKLGFLDQDHCVFDAMMGADWAFYSQFMQICGNFVCAGRLMRTVKMQDGLVRDVESLQVPLADKDGVARFMLGVMINRSNRHRSVKACRGSPTSMIHCYQYLDLGCGLPPVNHLSGTVTSLINQMARSTGGAATPELPTTSGRAEAALLN